MDSIQQDFIRTMVDELDERSRRIFLGGYAGCLGRGGISTLSRCTGVSRATISQGIKDYKEVHERVLASGQEPPPLPKKVRVPGGGRKSVLEKYPNLKEELFKLFDGNIIENPESPFCWTTKSLRTLQGVMLSRGMEVCHSTIGGLLEDFGFQPQLNRKSIGAGEKGLNRDEQFRFINERARKHLSSGVPVISVEIEKTAPAKNPLVDDTEEAAPNADAQEELINIGLCVETAPLAVNCVKAWWYEMGRLSCPNCRRMMITVGGGGNGCRSQAWKEGLENLAKENGIEIQCSHFPMGMFRWNRVGHSFVSRVCKKQEGKPDEILEITIQLIAPPEDGTPRKQGSRSTATDVAERPWFHDWNYTINPRSSARAKG